METTDTALAAKDIIGAPAVTEAIQELLLRAERQPDVELLVATFADPGAVASELNNDNNQVLVGRRGTCKTHILRVLATRRQGLTVYLDLRQLAQTPRVGEDQIPPAVRVASIFQILLRAIGDRIAEHVATLSGEKARRASAALKVFWDATATISREGEIISQERSNTSTSNASDSIGATLGPRSAVSVGIAASETESTSERNTVRGGRATAQLHFADVDQTLRALMDASELTRLFVIVDEWTTIPYELQPLFADYLNRALFDNPQVTVKIASVAYRSSFETPGQHNTRIGLEAGDDFTFVELDKYFVYKRAPDRVARFFAELLWRHLSVESALAAWQQRIQPKRLWLFTRGSTSPHEQEKLVIEELRDLFRKLGDNFMDERATEYMRAEFRVDGPDALVAAMFTGRQGRNGTFHELVQASQGVVRDFIYILSKAYAEAAQRGSPKIDKESVADAAGDWHSQDKKQKVSQEQAGAFGRVVDHVIKHGDSDLFLIESELERHEIVEALYDLRLVHLIQRRIRLPEAPTTEYTQYAIDYGTYKQLLSNRPRDQRDIPTVDARASKEGSGAPSHGVIVPRGIVTGAG